MISLKKELTPKIIVSLFIIFFSSSIFSYAFWPSSSLISPQGDLADSPTIDPGEPKTEACPLNGALYTKTEQTLWEQRRPLPAMIENHS